MSILGIDIGTTGCKSVVFSIDGRILASSYESYDIIIEKPGYAEFDSMLVWQKIKNTIKNVVLETRSDPIKALSVCSLGEAMVPVTHDREIISNSILGLDTRGDEFISQLLTSFSKGEVFRINGNIPGSGFSLTSLAWLKKNKTGIYNKADHFLLWADFVCYMLGADPVTNYSLAGRTMLFDIHKKTWSDSIMEVMEFDPSKFARPVPSGVKIGEVSKEVSDELGLRKGVNIISGGHDQCCAALGCGIFKKHRAMYGLGTFTCVVPIYPELPDMGVLYTKALNIENHVVPDLYVSLLYNFSGGALVKWFRDMFTETVDGCERKISYDNLFREIPDRKTDIIVIPRFGPTGPPDYFSKPAGCFAGLSFAHSKGDVLRAILEGITFYFKDNLSLFEKQNIPIHSFVSNGGGANSPAWLQITADIINRPVIKNTVTEAGTLGAAILAATGGNLYGSIESCVESMIHKDCVYQPDPKESAFYNEKFLKFLELYKLLKD